MEEDKKFCDACGAPLVPGEKECVACGQPVEKIQPPANEPVISAEEWSKPAVVETRPEGEHDRYGTPADEEDRDSAHRWGTPAETPEPRFMTEPAPVSPAKPAEPFTHRPDPITPAPLPYTPAVEPKKNNKLWIILLVAFLLLCLCLVIFGASGIIGQLGNSGY